MCLSTHYAVVFAEVVPAVADTLAVSCLLSCCSPDRCCFCCVKLLKPCLLLLLQLHCFFRLFADVDSVLLGCWHVGCLPPAPAFTATGSHMRDLRQLVVLACCMSPCPVLLTLSFKLQGHKGSVTKGCSSCLHVRSSHTILLAA